MTAQNPNLAALSAAGVSVWLDDLSRDRLRSGNLQELIDTKSVVGVTTNPSIFQKALSEGHTYDAQIAELAARGADVDATIRTVTTDDVRSACDVLVPQWEDSDGVDGRVSIEVDPRLAHETEKTIQQAIELWKIVDRPNLFIKTPATKAGLPAISAVLAEGISVNVTLIFSVQRYREVMDAYLTGMEKARKPDTACPRSIRWHRFSSPGWTPKSTSGWTESARGKRSNCAARPVSPMPAWPMPPTGRSSKTAIVIGPSRSTAPGSSARCGLPPA
ncbi:transaldolase [Mycobacterium tuberculosis]|nr:transaldolase [Mycobacterium tuberculosis]